MPQTAETHATAATRPALPAGTTVLTLAGALPVEFLGPGDRIITRDGARPLRAIRSHVEPLARMIRVSAAALGSDTAQDDLLVTPDMPIVLRDWRARALRGCPEAAVEAARLVDGDFIRAETTVGQRLFTLDFDAPVVIYAGGQELALAPALAA